MIDPIKILVVDDHQMFLDGLKALLAGRQDYKVVMEAHNGVEAMDIIRENQIDNIITDLSMPEMDGIELIENVKNLYPHIKILVLSMYNNRETIAQILMSEAEGYILKNTGKKELLLALSRINNSGTFYSNEVMSIMMEIVRYDKRKEKINEILTARELEILHLIVKELSSEEIAERLFISKRTVDTHRVNILNKTHSKTIVGLIKYAFEHGLVNPSA